MTFSVQLDYSTLLAENDLQAFQDAMSTTLALDFPHLLDQLTVTLGLPQSPDQSDLTISYVPLTSTNPAQPQPEGVNYLRLDIGKYMECCQRFISVADATDATTIAAWMQSEHGLWFDPTLLNLSGLSPDPDNSDRQLQTVTIGSTNYVWVGSVTLYAVAANHLALLAKPGTAKGLIQADVMVA